MSFKTWWNSLWKGNRSDSVQTPAVKNISEPVQTLIRLFKENPKRFKFEYEHRDTEGVPVSGGCGSYYRMHNDFGSSIVTMVDSKTNEKYIFGVSLSWEAVQDYRYQLFFSRRFGSSKVYPVLGWKLVTKPNWMTEDETSCISKTLVPYFLGRVNRYREIVNYRKERTEESHKRKTELDKKKERQRLINVYKGE